jgi:hypothetical protein
MSRFRRATGITVRTKEFLMHRVHPLLGTLLLLMLISSTADARNPYRTDFINKYPSVSGTPIVSLPSNAGHCGMCHLDSTGRASGTGTAIVSRRFVTRATTNSTAFTIMEAEDMDGDGFVAYTEILDAANYSNTPTFPGLAIGDLSRIVNIPPGEVSPYLTPTAAVDQDPPTVAIIAPASGVVLEANTVVPITWTASDPSGVASISIAHSDDGGISWKPVALGLANTGTHAWFVPHLPGSDNKIRIEASDTAGNTGTEVSAGNFDITRILTGRVPTTLRDVDFPGTQPVSGVILSNPDTNCATCHGNYDTDHEPWANWRGSMMAQSARDPLFYACLAVAEQDAPSVGDICLRCHSPRGWLAGRSIDTSGESLTQEDRHGISCDFCHKLVDWNYVEGLSPAEDADILAALENVPTEYTSGQYVVAPTAAKRGPRADSLENGHPVLVSNFHRSSDLCGTCHDVSNPAFSKVSEGMYAPNTFDEAHETMVQSQMLPVERTYSEWKNSDFAAGGVYLEQYGGVVSTCQDCHMSRVTAYAANDPEAPLRTDMPLHDMTGGNAFMQDLVAAAYPGEVDPLQLAASKARAQLTLQKAVQLELESDVAGVNVRVVNDTGHKLPTGYPEGRRMWLSVEARNAADEVVYTSGDYDATTGVLHYDAALKIYQIKPGFTPALAAALSLPAGPSFHFVLNDTVYVDNRIPPRGFTNENFVNLQMPPIGYAYEDGQYWDDTYYTLPNTAVTVTARLWYQAVSKEYVEFLRDENVTNEAGNVLYDLWAANGRGAPSLMAEATIPVEILTSAEPETVVSFGMTRPTPNPFGSKTSFSFSTGAPGKIDLSVFDVRGRRVRVLENEIRPAGRFTMHWDGRDDRGSALAAGVYFVRLQAGEFVASERVVLVR